MFDKIPIMAMIFAVLDSCTARDLSMKGWPPEAQRSLGKLQKSPGKVPEGSGGSRKSKYRTSHAMDS